MTTGSMSQDGYASAVGSLDWLDVSYSPLQLTEKFRLPTLVRIGEGHYGNADDTCFSAMEVVKLHGVQRVDMVIAQGLNDKDDPSSAPPIRICLPRGLPSLFNVHQTEDGNDKGAKLYKSVRQLSDDSPQCVVVLKKPLRRDCGVVKGDILRTIGITMGNGLFEQGLRCRKQSEPNEDVFLNLKWKGQYRTISDPDGYTLANLLSQNKLPCMVSLRSPEDHVSQLSGSISNLLPHLERPLVLEREITTEFLVGTTIGGGPCSSPKEHFGNDGRSVSLSRTQNEQQQPAIVVLSKNANVCFQICQDMVHRRITYTSLIDMFGECMLDKIPLELFISEYAAPFVAFMRSDLLLEAPPTATSRNSQRSQWGLSRSTPDLPSTLNDNEDMFHQESTSEEVIHNYADPGIGAKSRRALPPLPNESQPRISFIAQPHTNTLPVSSLKVNHENEIDQRAIRQLKGINTQLASSWPKSRSTTLGPLKLTPTDYPSQIGLKPLRFNPVSVPHTDPPPGFTSDSIETGERHQEDQFQSPSSESPERLPIRRAPPPPPRTTTTRKVKQESIYSNLDSASPPPSPLLPAGPSPNNDVTLPSKPTGGSPPEVVPRRGGGLKKGSHSLNTDQRPSTDRLVAHSMFHTIPLKRGKESRAISVAGSLDSSHDDTHADYLQPRKPRAVASTKPAASPRTESFRSHHHSTGLLLDNIDLLYVKPTKERSSSESNLQISGLQATSIRTVKDIPLDIGNLTCSQLMQCLRLLNLDDQVVEQVQRSQINGSLLAQLSAATVKEELALSDFEAEKFDAFRQGWRPDDSEAS